MFSITGVSQCSKFTVCPCYIDIICIVPFYFISASTIQNRESTFIGGAFSNKNSNSKANFLFRMSVHDAQNKDTSCSVFWETVDSESSWLTKRSEPKWMLALINAIFASRQSVTLFFQHAVQVMPQCNAELLFNLKQPKVTSWRKIVCRSV